MELLMTHGYMLTGTGSNIYVQNLCRALVQTGHAVHLLCQDPDPARFDFVDRALTASASGVELLREQETPYSGRCSVYQPRIGDLLPVYVYDDYPGWRVKTFLDLSEEELSDYLSANTDALASALASVTAAAQTGTGIEFAATNHSLPGPLVARRVLEPAGIPYVSVVHGSCLQYVARHSPRYMDLAREGLAAASSIVALSGHSAGTIAEDFPEFEPKTRSLPGGVDTTTFAPERLDLNITYKLLGGCGRSEPQRTALRGLLEPTGSPLEADLTARGLGEISGSYDARQPDVDAGDRIRTVLQGPEPVIVYVGKLIHSKGVHSLLAAFPEIHAATNARLLIFGFGTFREALEALNLSFNLNDTGFQSLFARAGRRFEGGPSAPVEHFSPQFPVPDESICRAARAVEFVGPLYHEELSRLLPRADVAVVPSIFPETFGLVAAEFGASGVVPFVADHSGLREAGAHVGQDLDFDLRVSLEGSFQDNLSYALISYLRLPEGRRRAAERRVRRNCVEGLSWEALADNLLRLAPHAADPPQR